MKKKRVKCCIWTQIGESCWISNLVNLNYSEQTNMIQWIRLCYTWEKMCRKLTFSDTVAGVYFKSPYSTRMSCTVLLNIWTNSEDMNLTSLNQILLQQKCIFFACSRGWQIRQKLPVTGQKTPFSCWQVLIFPPWLYDNTIWLLPWWSCKAVCTILRYSTEKYKVRSVTFT